MLAMTDRPEKRVKCNYCGQDLSYLEFMLLDGKCLFHAEGGLTALRNMSIFAYIRLLLGDLAVVRGKLRLKDRGLTHIDWQATVSEVAPELHDFSRPGNFDTLVKHMLAHTGHHEC
jgi:hypothetical protein